MCIRGAGTSAWPGSTCGGGGGGGSSLGLSCGSPHACGIIHEAVPLGYVSIKVLSMQRDVKDWMGWGWEVGKRYMMEGVRRW